MSKRRSRERHPAVHVLWVGYIVLLFVVGTLKTRLCLIQVKRLIPLSTCVTQLDSVGSQKRTNYVLSAILSGLFFPDQKKDYTGNNHQAA